MSSKEAPLLTDGGSAPSSSRRFSPWIQFAGVASYFGCDLVLRFLYQAVLDGSGQADDGAATNNNEADGIEAYSKPALLTLCCYMSFVLWGPILVFPYTILVRRMSIYTYYTSEWCGALGFQSAVQHTIAMATILFFGNLGYVAGLEYIHVALATALSQGEAPSTILFSVLLLGRVFGPWEQRGIVLCFTGIALIAIPPMLRARNLTTESGLGGEALAIMHGVLSTASGAIGFGMYQVFWPFFDGRRFPPQHPLVQPPSTPQHAVIDTFATLTLVGAYCISCGWIVLVVLHLVGWETFEAPPRPVWASLALASLMSALVDALNAVACVVATAVVVALAYPLTIPMSVVLDYMVNGIPIRSWGLLGWIGTVAVVMGVFCLEADSHDSDQEHGDALTTHDCEEQPIGVNITTITGEYKEQSIGVVFPTSPSADEIKAEGYYT